MASRPAPGAQFLQAVMLTVVSQEEMKFYRLPIEYRDFCANLLIPLSQCRNREFYAPWKCIDERYTLNSPSN